MKLSLRGSARSGRRARSRSSPRCCARPCDCWRLDKNDLESFLHPLLDRPRITHHPDRRRHVRFHRRMPRAISCRSTLRRARRGDRHDRSGLRAASLSPAEQRPRCSFRLPARATARKASPQSNLRSRWLAKFIILRSRAIAMARLLAKLDVAIECMRILLPEETHDRSFAMTSSFSLHDVCGARCAFRHRRNDAAARTNRRGDGRRHRRRNAMPMRTLARQRI